MTSTTSKKSAFGDESDQLTGETVLTEPDGRWFDFWKHSRGFYALVPGLETVLPPPSSQDSWIGKAFGGSPPEEPIGVLVCVNPRKPKEPPTVKMDATWSDFESVAAADDAVVPVIVSGRGPPSRFLNSMRADFFEGESPPDSWRFAVLSAALASVPDAVAVTTTADDRLLVPPASVSAREESGLRPTAAALQLLRALELTATACDAAAPGVRDLFVTFVASSAAGGADPVVVPELELTTAPVFDEPAQYARTPVDFLVPFLGEIAGCLPEIVATFEYETDALRSIRPVGSDAAFVEVSRHVVWRAPARDTVKRSVTTYRAKLDAPPAFGPAEGQTKFGKKGVAPTDPVFKVLKDLTPVNRFAVVVFDGPDLPKLEGLEFVYSEHKWTPVAAVLQWTPIRAGGGKILFTTIVSSTDMYYFHTVHDGTPAAFIGETIDAATESIADLPLSKTHRAAPLAIVFRTSDQNADKVANTPIGK